MKICTAQAARDLPSLCYDATIVGCGEYEITLNGQHSRCRVADTAGYIIGPFGDEPQWDGENECWRDEIRVGAVEIRKRDGAHETDGPQELQPGPQRIRVQGEPLGYIARGYAHVLANDSDVFFVETEIGRDEEWSKRNLIAPVPIYAAPLGPRPIETAPRDGSEVLVLFRPSWGEPEWLVASWREGDGYRGEEGSFAWRPVRNSVAIFPTHWHPLPEVPA